jgi:hypothetical protein
MLNDVLQNLPVQLGVQEKAILSTALDPPDRKTSSAIKKIVQNQLQSA